MISHSESEESICNERDEYITEHLINCDMLKVSFAYERQNSNTKKILIQFYIDANFH